MTCEVNIGRSWQSEREQETDDHVAQSCHRSWQSEREQETDDHVAQSRVSQELAE